MKIFNYISPFILYNELFILISLYSILIFLNKILEKNKIVRSKKRKFIVIITIFLFINIFCFVLIRDAEMLIHFYLLFCFIILIVILYSLFYLFTHKNIYFLFYILLNIFILWIFTLLIIGSVIIEINEKAIIN